MDNIIITRIVDKSSTAEHCCDENNDHNDWVLKIPLVFYIVIHRSLLTSCSSSSGQSTAPACRVSILYHTKAWLCCKSSIYLLLVCFVVRHVDRLATPSRAKYCTC